MFKTIIPLAIAATLAVLLTADPSAASNAIAKAQDKVCTTCHDKPGSKLLTDEGRYFELTRSLEGYDELEAEFGRCTSCHVRKPGNTKLTKTGRRYQRLMTDMEGIRDFVLDRHPVVDLVDAEESTDSSDTAAEPEKETAADNDSFER